MSDFIEIPTDPHGERMTLATKNIIGVAVHPIGSEYSILLMSGNDRYSVFAPYHLLRDAWMDGWKFKPREHPSQYQPDWVTALRAATRPVGMEHNLQLLAFSAPPVS